MYIIYKTIGAFNYYLKIKKNSWERQPHLTWYGIMDNATKFPSGHKAKIAANTYGIYEGDVMCIKNQQP